jgi:hypothetical protein
MGTPDLGHPTDHSALSSPATSEIMKPEDRRVNSATPMKTPTWGSV